MIWQILIAGAIIAVISVSIFYLWHKFLTTELEFETLKSEQLFQRPIDSLNVELLKFKISSIIKWG